MKLRRPFAVAGQAAGALALAAGLFGANAFAQPKAEAEIASISGQGEVREFQQRDWMAAKAKQPLYASNYVRTLAMSRMALLYSDGTQEQLSANTVIQIIGTPGTQPASTRLERGRAWTQSKTTPTGVTMQTPWAAAAIRGTDWEMEVADNGDATLSVFSGEVEFYNEHGRVVVRPGEQAHVERGKAPVKLRLQVSRERIQWVSSFTVDPRRYAEFQPEPSDPGLRAVAADIREGRLGDAFARVKARADSTGARAIDLLLLADFQFYEGDIDAAQATLARGMASFPADPRFDVGLARAALLHDDFAAAARHAHAALAKGPDSVDALVMLGEVERREGRAPEAIAAYGKAAEVAARDPRGWLGLGIVETERENVRHARSSLEQAIALDSSDADARAELGTLEGFAGNLPRGREALEKALELQPDNYVAWTGLGVLKLKAGDEEGAIDALVRASLLEPRYARAHLYLAAAYYQARHDAAALFELKRAAESDPKDPLPHLLTSIIHLDRIEPGLAAAEAREALARIPYLKSLNQVADNQKGVANVGAPLAFMGLEEWARSAAYDSDLPLWGGSHLFLADRYSGDFDRRSELMQGFVADPLAFGGSNRFQSLISEPGHYGTIAMHYARNDDVSLFEPVLTLNGSGVTPFPTSYYVEGIYSRFQPGNASISAKGPTYTVALGAKPTYEVSAFVYANRLDVKADLAAGDAPRDSEHIEGTTSRVDVGLRFAPDARQALWLKAGGFREDATLDEQVRLDLPGGSIVRDTHFRIKPDGTDLALRHTFVASDRLEWTWGVEGARQKLPSFLSRDSDARFEDTTVAVDTVDETDHDRSDIVYGLARIGSRDLRWEIGADWRDYRKDRDISVALGSGGVFPAQEQYRRRAGDPMLGVTWRFAPAMVARAACRRWLRPASFDTMAPVAIAGMALEDQLVLPGGVLEQCRGQWEWTDSHGFAMARVERTRVHNLVSPLNGVLNTQSDLSNPERLRNRILAQPPKPDLLENTPEYGEGTATRASVALERLITQKVTARAYYTYSDSENTASAFSGLKIPYLPRHQASFGASWAPGWHAFLNGFMVYRTQRFADEPNTQALPSGWDLQLDAFIETSDKHWSLELSAANLLKKGGSDTFGVIATYRF